MFWSPVFILFFPINFNSKRFQLNNLPPFEVLFLIIVLLSSSFEFKYEGVSLSSFPIYMN